MLATAREECGHCAHYRNSKLSKVEIHQQGDKVILRDLVSNLQRYVQRQAVCDWDIFQNATSNMVAKVTYKPASQCSIYIYMCMDLPVTFGHPEPKK